jgi:hypothetical protein
MALGPDVVGLGVGVQGHWDARLNEECVSLAHGHHHWHYRPAGSLDREEYPGFLRHHRFRLEDTWKDE